MKTLTSEDTQKLLRSIHTIYSLRDLDAFGRDSLAILERLVPIEAAVRTDSDTAFVNAHFHCNTSDLEHMFASDFVVEMKQHLSESPFYQNLSLFIKGSHAYSDFMTLSDLQRTKTYQKIIKRVGFDNVIGFMLYSSSKPPYTEGRFASYVFYQDWNRFTERDRLLLNLFQPHLQQAFENTLHCQQQQQTIAQLQRSLDQSGVVFLDPAGTVQRITMQAERWLQQ